MRTNGCDVAAGCVTKQSESSIRSVVGPAAVAQKRSRASGGVFIYGVDKELCSAETRVEVSGCFSLERKPTYGSIICASGQAKESILSFCCVTPGIAPIRRRAHCLRILGERKAGKREHRERGTKNICFHMFFPFMIVLGKLRTNASINPESFRGQ